jgi:hypothetical protein
VNDSVRRAVLFAVRRKRILLPLVIAAGAAGAMQWFAPSDSLPSAERRMEVQGGSDTSKVAAAPVLPPVLPPRETLARPFGQPFRPLSWEPPVAKGASTSTGPSRPSMPYRVAGTVTYEAGPEIVLAKGNTVVMVREGDMLEDGYRVDAVGPDHVELVFVPSGIVERLPIATATETPSTAAAGGSPPPVSPLPFYVPPLPPLSAPAR